MRKTSWRVTPQEEPYYPHACIHSPRYHAYASGPHISRACLSLLQGQDQATGRKELSAGLAQPKSLLKRGEREMSVKGEASSSLWCEGEDVMVRPSFSHRSANIINGIVLR